MGGFRFVPVHIAIKDLSFMVIYFIIMKYNLTDETYLPDTMKYFPGAPTMSFWNIVSASVFYNLIPIIVSAVLYYPIVQGLKNLLPKSKLRLIITGFVLTLTTPILYLVLSGFKHNDYYQLFAESIAWILCFIASIAFYYLINSKERLINT